jgi:DNA mismatch repair protein MutS2
VAFVPGDEVHVAALGTGVVREVRNGGRYSVVLKGRTIVVTEQQLTRAGDRRKRAASSSRVEPERAMPTASPSAPASLDLHGMIADEAVAALDSFLNDALLAGHPEVRVIHGRSGGRLKAAVHARLKQITSVRAARLDPRNPGVTIVRL